MNCLKDCDIQEYIDDIVLCRTLSIDSIVHPYIKDPDKIDELRMKLYYLLGEIKNKGFRAIVDCTYNLLMKCAGRTDKLPEGCRDVKTTEPSAEEDNDSEVPVIEENRPGIQVLDIVNYMICPPVSGGMLRILSPLEKMSRDCGIVVDMIFGTWNISRAKNYEEYLRNLEVIGFAKGVVLPLYTKDIPGRPDDLPKDVWITINKKLLDTVIDRVSNKKYDIIQIEHSQLSWMVPAIRAASPDSKIVLDAHNVEYRVYETWLPFADRRNVAEITENYENMKEWESRSWPLYDSAFVVSLVEQDIVQEGGLKKVYSVPTGGGVDLDKYAPPDNCEKPYDLLYIGSMNWFPNYHGLKWFLHEVFPLIKSKKPDVNFQIVGSGDPDDALLSSVSKTEGVKFWGFQKDDVSFFHKSKLFIVPLWIGAGARVKIPTAWASGIPIVSTEFGAEGLLAENGRNILLSNDPQVFADNVLSLLDNPELAKKISENALQTVSDYYRVEYCAEKLIEDYKEILKG